MNVKNLKTMSNVEEMPTEPSQYISSAEHPPDQINPLRKLQTCLPESVNPITQPTTCELRADNRCVPSTTHCEQAGRASRSPGTIYIDSSSPTSYDFNLFTALDPLCNAPITCYLCDGINYTPLSDATVDYYCHN